MTAHRASAQLPTLCLVAGALWTFSSVLGGAFAGLRGSRSRGAQVQRHVVETAPPYVYERSKKSSYELTYGNDVGYFPDGTAYNMAGNAVNHPETIGPDLHVEGSPLPKGHYTNSVGYTPDGTPMNMAGNDINHPENIQPDTHVPGSPLPPPLFGFTNSIGYLPDGTPMDLAGNEINHFTGTLPDGTRLDNGHAV